jgi:hypothetical protein
MKLSFKLQPESFRCQLQSAFVIRQNLEEKSVDDAAFPEQQEPILFAGNNAWAEDLQANFHRVPKGGLNQLVRFQPSLRDYSSSGPFPGLTSWASFNRPSGTNHLQDLFEDWGCFQSSRSTSSGQALRDYSSQDLSEDWGCFQSSPFDKLRAGSPGLLISGSFPGLTSWASFNRPSGTNHLQDLSEDWGCFQSSRSTSSGQALRDYSSQDLSQD